MTSDLHDLAALYAVDALDADEAERFARHLPGCLACQQELAAMRTASTALAVAVATPLPAGLRDRILADAGRSAQVPPAPSQPAVGYSPNGASDPAIGLDPAVSGGRTTADDRAVGFDPAVAGGQTVADDRPVGFDPAVTGDRVPSLDAARAARERRRRPGQRLLTAAAAVVAVAALSLGALVASGIGRDGGNGLDAAAGRADAEAALAGLGAASDIRTVDLAGPDGTVRVAWSASRNQVVLLADGLPDPGDGRVYELWRIDAAGPDAAGLFDTDGSGAAGLVAPLDGADPAGWGVTVEPDGGSPQPTPPIVYQAEA